MDFSGSTGLNNAEGSIHHNHINKTPPSSLWWLEQKAYNMTNTPSITAQSKSVTLSSFYKKLELLLDKDAEEGSRIPEETCEAEMESCSFAASDCWVVSYYYYSTTFLWPCSGFPFKGGIRHTECVFMFGITRSVAFSVGLSSTLPLTPHNRIS